MSISLLLLLKILFYSIARKQGAQSIILMWVTVMWKDTIQKIEHLVCIDPSKTKFWGKTCLDLQNQSFMNHAQVGTIKSRLVRAKISAYYIIASSMKDSWPKFLFKIKRNHLKLVFYYRRVYALGDDKRISFFLSQKSTGNRIQI